MKLNRVLIVFKSHIGGFRSDSTSPHNLKRWQQIHKRSHSLLEKNLRNLSIDYKTIDRKELSTNYDCDLIIALGGDGTVLAAAHAAGNVPILGVNSMPGHSVGFFCAATATGFPAIMNKIAQDKIISSKLPLLEAHIGNKFIPVNALNEVLFTGTSPAEMLRYRITIKGQHEEQRSSGVWIAAGPGSTAAILAAGGRRMPITSSRLQYLVREPHKVTSHRYRFTKGILPNGSKISLIPHPGEATVYIDGASNSFHVPANTNLTVKVSEKTLSIFL